MATARGPSREGASNCGFSPGWFWDSLCLADSLASARAARNARVDDKGFCTGPLPSAQGYKGIFQRQATGAFKTTGSEQWPAKLCQWLSALLLSSCLRPAQDAVGWQVGAKPDDSLPEADFFPINEPARAPSFLPPAKGGKPFHDGGGLCSPGRWPVAPPCQELCRRSLVGMARGCWNSSPLRWVPRSS